DHVAVERDRHRAALPADPLHVGDEIPRPLALAVGPLLPLLLPAPTADQADHGVARLGAGDGFFFAFDDAQFGPRGADRWPRPGRDVEPIRLAEGAFVLDGFFLALVVFIGPRLVEFQPAIAAGVPFPGQEGDDHGVAALAPVEVIPVQAPRDRLGVLLPV